MIGPAEDGWRGFLPAEIYDSVCSIPIAFSSLVWQMTKGHRDKH